MYWNIPRSTMMVYIRCIAVVAAYIHRCIKKPLFFAQYMKHARTRILTYFAQNAKVTVYPHNKHSWRLKTRNADIK